MNWQIEGQLAHLDMIDVEVTRSHTEDPEVMPDAGIMDAAQTAASEFALALGTSDAYVTLSGHEDTVSDGFRAAHVSVTASRINTTGA